MALYPTLRARIHDRDRWRRRCRRRCGLRSSSVTLRGRDEGRRPRRDHARQRRPALARSSAARRSTTASRCRSAMRPTRSRRSSSARSPASSRPSRRRHADDPRHRARLPPAADARHQGPRVPLEHPVRSAISRCPIRSWRASSAAANLLIPIADPVGGALSFSDARDRLRVHPRRREEGGPHPAETRATSISCRRSRKDNGWEMYIDHTHEPQGYVLQFQFLIQDYAPSLTLKLGRLADRFHAAADHGRRGVRRVATRIWVASIKMEFVIVAGVGLRPGGVRPADLSRASATSTTSSATQGREDDLDRADRLRRPRRRRS